MLDQKADLVVADITITYEREQGVDFTMPFMNLGVTILYKKPNKKVRGVFTNIRGGTLRIGHRVGFHEAEGHNPLEESKQKDEGESLSF